MYSWKALLLVFCYKKMALLQYLDPYANVGSEKMSPTATVFLNVKDNTSNLN